MFRMQWIALCAIVSTASARGVMEFLNVVPQFVDVSSAADGASTTQKFRERSTIAPRESSALIPSTVDSPTATPADDRTLAR